jgi:hypothetical protein
MSIPRISVIALFRRILVRHGPARFARDETEFALQYARELTLYTTPSMSKGRLSR